jgi:hypothetical protein
MSNTIIYSSYNGYPGRPTTPTVPGYNWFTGKQPPLLPTVNLYNNFSFEIKATTANSFLPSTTEETGSTAGYAGYASSGVRNGVAPQSARYGVAGTNIYKAPTAMRWLTNLGPNGNAVAQNERGDWFTTESLTTADQNGGGIKLTSVLNGSSDGTQPFTYLTSTPNYTDTYNTLLPACNSLKISGSYNAAVFCYNQFDYINDYSGNVYSAKSLYELPEKIDNLVSFVPDQRQSTTLTFWIAVDWVRFVNWGVWDTIFSEETKQSFLASYGTNGIPASGTDLHMVTHVINNNNPNWSKILREIISKRQRSLSEQDDRYGQIFPDQVIEVE